VTNKNLKVTCPTCGKKDTWKADNAFKPFCSDRCKLIDLGEWASEKRRIAGEERVENDDEGDEER
jgi:endogenous inhibitor of DNA gyrase (YacG/DUF329 family)